MRTAATTRVGSSSPHGLGVPDIRLALLIVGALVASAVVPLAAHAADGNTVCTDLLATSVKNVSVPAGAVCTLSGGAVTKNISVAGTLIVGDGVIINGNLNAAKGAFVQLAGASTELNGDYSATGAVSAIIAVTISGNVEFKGGSYGLVATARNATCSGGASGALNVPGSVLAPSLPGVGGSTGTCAIDLQGALTFMTAAADAGGGGGTGTVTDVCKKAVVKANAYNDIAAGWGNIKAVAIAIGNHDLMVTAAVNEVVNQAKAVGVLEGGCGTTG
jgi:hypothetical protein